MLKKPLTGMVFLAAATVLLTGCTPTTLAYIWNDGGNFVLTVPDECSYEISDVEVRYYDDEDDSAGFEDLPLVWKATAEPGSGSKTVTLFQANDGFTVEQPVAAVDTSREFAIGWLEDWGDDQAESEFGSTLFGSLDDVEGDNVLWSGGVGSLTSYQDAVGLPWAQVRC